MKPTRGRLVILLVVLVTVTLVGVYTVPRLVIGFVVSKLAEDPRFRMTPRPLDLGDVSSEPGTNIDWYAHRFEVPWVDGVEEDAKESRVIAFPSGARVAMTEPDKAINFRDELTRKVEEEGAEAESLLGEGDLDSSHGLMQRILEYDPESLEFFDPWAEQVRATILMALKGMLTAGGKTGIYSFDRGGIRGFQLGDPARAKGVLLYFFDETDRTMEVFVNGATSQAEVNRVITTFREAD